MNYKISNSKLSVEISSKGGELRSIQDAEGKEYLWQGDVASWTDRGPNLFPYIGRMTDGQYRYQGKMYHMDIHGFLPYMEMTLVEKKEDELVLRLKNTPETELRYPFLFELDICWKLIEDTLQITYQVRNKDTKTMYFGIGGHPGFCVPIADGLVFEEYCIDFGENAQLSQVVLSDDCFVTENTVPVPLVDDRYLPLRHGLFDRDAIVLNEMPKSLMIESKKDCRKIRVVYEDMNYLGIWHWPKMKVNYVCIEPWSSLPSRKGITEDLETQPNLLRLESGCEYRNTWSITIEK